MLCTCPEGSTAKSLKAHAPDQGSAPILVSVATLRKLGAIIDFRTDEAVFTAVNDRTLVKLKRSTTGHQLIPLTQDFLESGMTLANRVMSLRQLVGSTE